MYFITGCIGITYSYHRQLSHKVTHHPLTSPPQTECREQIRGGVRAARRAARPAPHRSTTHRAACRRRCNPARPPLPLARLAPACAPPPQHPLRRHFRPHLFPFPFHATPPLSQSFQSPKWLEYAAAYCGALAIQGDPIEWVSSHRYHHMHTDTPLDPHTPYEGFWWSHAGWLLDNEATLERVADRSNATDMANQPFYQWLLKSYNWHVIGSAAAIFAIGGLPMFLWAYCFRICWVWHITWFVNSASHVWGTQTYNTGDLSRNNWWVGILAFGEGWHNNHHAFEFSARHGLEWWQVDLTWGIVSVLKALGLVTKVKLPTKTQLDKLRIVPQAA